MNHIKNNWNQDIEDAIVIEETHDKIAKKTTAEEVEIVLTKPLTLEAVQKDMVERMKRIKNNPRAQGAFSFIWRSEENADYLTPIRVDKNHPLLPLLQYAKSLNKEHIEDGLAELLGFIYKKENPSFTKALPSEVTTILVTIEYGFKQYNEQANNRNVAFCDACFALVCGLGDKIKENPSLELELELFEINMTR